MTAFTACGTKQAKDTDADNQGKKLEIVTTIFPEYDWVRNILGEKADNTELTMLLDNGVDLHSYQPTADDLSKISSCDMFIYVGGESDEWVEDALASAPNPNRKVIKLMDVVDDLKEEEIIEGMEAEDEHEHEENEELVVEDIKRPEYDEHVWLSLKNTEKICQTIADTLSEITGETYSADAYIEELKSLDKEYKSAVDSSDKKVLLFGDRFPFRYMTDDYGLDYYAAFVGCSAEMEARTQKNISLHV